jgi:hypothetical protein
MIMKTNQLIITLSAVAVAAFVAGCGDSKSKTEEKPAETGGAASSTSQTLSESANQAVQSAKAAATNVVEQAKTVATNAVAQVEQAAASATVEVQKAVESAKTSATNAVADATKQVEAAAASATAQAQSLIDKAKGLITEKNYQEALASLQQLTGYQLTADQEKVVEELKTAVQAGLNSETAKAVKGLFKK